MNFAAAVLLLCTASTAPPPACFAVSARQEPRDAWIAPDKVRHGLAAYAVVAFSYGGLRALGTEDATTLLVAAGAGAAASLGKEWLDARAGGSASVRDLVWDAAGIAAALLLMREMR